MFLERGKAERGLNLSNPEAPEALDPIQQASLILQSSNSQNTSISAV